MRFSGVILAGGRSTRMGRNKAWIEHAGQTLLARQLQTLVELELDEIFISGGPGTDYSRFGYPVLVDRKEDQGPLAGVERALAAANNELLLVLAVDMPRMTTAYLRGRLSLASEGRGWVPRLDDRFEPLAAIYPKACYDLARALLDDGLPQQRVLGEEEPLGGTSSTSPQVKEPFAASWNDSTETSASSVEPLVEGSALRRKRFTASRLPQEGMLVNQALEVGRALRCASSTGVRETLAGVQGTARPTGIKRSQRKAKGSMQRFVAACREAGLVEIADVATADELLFSNWNRPEDLMP